MPVWEREDKHKRMRKRAKVARRLFQVGDDARAGRVLWGPERKLTHKAHRGSVNPPDLPRALGWVMAIGTAVILAIMGAVALDRWPNITARFGPQVVAHIDTDGSAEVVVRRERSGHYVVPGTVNGVEAEFLIDTGATGVAIPPDLARRLKLRRGPEVEITTASDVIPGYLVTLDEVSVGPLTLKRVRGSVSEHSIGDQVLLGMSFLRHFELSQSRGTLTLRVPEKR